MRRSVFLNVCGLGILGFSSVVAFAQDPPPPPSPEPSPAEKAQPDTQANADPCPKITLKAPPQTVRDGVPVRLTASLAGGDKKVDPIFDWTISAGMIRSGQGTASIEIDTSGAGDDRAIHATLLIGGFPGQCTTSESAVITVAGPARKADEFGALPEAEMAAKIESFAALAPQSDQVYVLAYAGRNNVRGYASSSLRQIRSLAIKSGLPSDRLVTVDGGYREEAGFELWVVPVGAEAPSPTPTLTARDIVFPKPSAAAAKAKKPPR